VSVKKPPTFTLAYPVWHPEPNTPLPAK
jgi:hypothetical protein